MTPLLIANVLLQMSAATFLLMLLGLAALAGLGAGLIGALADKSAALPTPPLEASPDARRVAWLAGGASEVARQTLYDLARRGFVQLHDEEAAFRTERWVARQEGHPAQSLLDPLERAVFAQTARRALERDLLRSPELLLSISQACADHEQALVEQDLLHSASTLAAVRWTRYSGLILITLLGAYRMILAQDALLLLGIFMGMGLVGVLMSARGRRTTHRGERYLAALAAAYAPMRARVERPSGASAQDLSHLPLLGAIYGSHLILRAPSSPEEL